MAVSIIPAIMPNINVNKNLMSVLLANSENSPLNNNLNAFKFNDFIEFIKRSKTPMIRETVPLDTGMTFTIPIAIPLKKVEMYCLVVIFVVLPELLQVSFHKTQKNNFCFTLIKIFLQKVFFDKRRRTRRSTYPSNS